jgi:hypothetical protein
MAKKINQKAEKRLRNEAYQEKFKRDDDAEEKKTSKSKPVALFANWCRTAGHPASCSCTYSKIEIAAKDRRTSLYDCVNGKECPNHPR